MSTFVSFNSKDFLLTRCAKYVSLYGGFAEYRNYWSGHTNCAQDANGRWWELGFWFCALSQMNKMITFSLQPVTVLGWATPGTNSKEEPRLTLGGLQGGAES